MGTLLFIHTYIPPNIVLAIQHWGLTVIFPFLKVFIAQMARNLTVSKQHPQAMSSVCLLACHGAKCYFLQNSANRSVLLSVVTAMLVDSASATVGGEEGNATSAYQIWNAVRVPCNLIYYTTHYIYPLPY